ncbi:MAG: sugar ABC transporter ATP-binding protein [Treponema sp.]|jgi:ribose transport system ATP-binding protein|nr:sugar ABC transporter ATP-binding protein [Treponema sp.]
MYIQMRGIYKSFSHVAVLKDVDFTVGNSEVHALMGENGAGKSTLMKVLTGVYAKDSGDITVDGRSVNFIHPKQAEKAGIVFVYQELNTMNDLIVEENMFMGKEMKKAFGVVNKKAMVEKARQTIARLGVSIDPNAVMRTLSVGQQQMVEIAKALLADVKLLIMDEPTAALSPSETKVLFKVIERLKKDGVSIIYISHRMEEIFEICDRITVLRDGRYIATKEINETDMADLVRMMIGRDIGERFPKRNAKTGGMLFEVKDLGKKGVFDGISFSVRSGEVLGVAGLMGAGRTEIMKAIFGSLSYEKGSILIEGKPVRINTPLSAIKYGMGFITEDRKIEGLMLDDGIDKNISLNNLKLISNAGILNKSKEEKLISEAINKLLIKCSGKKQRCDELSGGNQQKVVFAKWIYTKPRLLILDEPTRGVDVGAKKEIYSIINELVENGVAVIFVSSELPEVLGMSDRIMAIHEGRVGGIIEKQNATQENVMLLCTGGTL